MATFYGPWQTAQLDGAWERWDDPRTESDDYEWADCHASNVMPYAAGDYDHPYGGTHVSGQWGIGKTSTDLYPRDGWDSASLSWSNGWMGMLRGQVVYDLSTYADTVLPAVAPPGVVGTDFDLGDPASWAWELQMQPSNMTSYRTVTQQPFDNTTVLEQIVDPDPDGLVAGMRWLLFLLPDDINLPTDHGLAQPPITDVADAGIIATAAALGMRTTYEAIQGFFQRSWNWQLIYDAMMAGPGPDVEMSMTAAGAPVTIPFAYPGPTSLPGRTGVWLRLLVCPSTTYELDPKAAPELPDWSRAALASNTPISVYRQILFNPPEFQVKASAPVRWRYEYGDFNQANNELPGGGQARAAATLEPRIHISKTGVPGAAGLPGDAYEAPIRLAGLSGMKTFDITGATVQNFENWSASGHTIWFRWVAPADGTASFDTAATPLPIWDSAISVWEDPDPARVPSSTPAWFDDDGFFQPGAIGSYGTSRVTFPCQSGHVYYLQIDSYDYSGAGYPRNNCVLRWSVT